MTDFEAENCVKDSPSVDVQVAMLTLSIGLVVIEHCSMPSRRAEMTHFKFTHKDLHTRTSRWLNKNKRRRRCPSSPAAYRRREQAGRRPCSRSAFSSSASRSTHTRATFSTLKSSAIDRCMEDDPARSLSNRSHGLWLRRLI